MLIQSLGMKKNRIVRLLFVIALIPSCNTKKEKYFIGENYCSSIETLEASTGEELIGIFEDEVPRGGFLRVRLRGDTVLSQIDRLNGYSKQSSLYSNSTGQVVFRSFDEESELGSKQNFEVINYTKNLRSIDTSASQFLLVEIEGNWMHIWTNGFVQEVDSIGLFWCGDWISSSKGFVLKLPISELEALDRDCKGRLAIYKPGSYTDSGILEVIVVFVNINFSRLVDFNDLVAFPSGLRDNSSTFFKNKIDPEVLKCLEGNSLK